MKPTTLQMVIAWLCQRIWPTEWAMQVLGTHPTKPQFIRTLSGSSAADSIEMEIMRDGGSEESSETTSVPRQRPNSQSELTALRLNLRSVMAHGLLLKERLDTASTRADALDGIVRSVDADVQRGEPCPICAFAPHREDCALVVALAPASAVAVPLEVEHGTHAHDSSDRAGAERGADDPHQLAVASAVAVQPEVAAECYLCAHCSRAVHPVHSSCVLDSGTTWTCAECGEKTVVSLSRIEASAVAVQPEQNIEDDLADYVPEFTVWAVRRGNTLPMVIDSIWVREDLAEKRAALMGKDQGWMAAPYSHLRQAPR